MNTPSELAPLPPLLGPRLKKAPLPVKETEETDPSDTTLDSGEEPLTDTSQEAIAASLVQEGDESPQPDSSVEDSIDVVNSSDLSSIEVEKGVQDVDNASDTSSNSTLDVSHAAASRTSNTVSALAPAAEPSLQTRDIKQLEVLPSFPSFTVNDDSKIEVLLAHHEMQVSMAKNNFSMSGFEASA